MTKASDRHFASFPRNVRFGDVLESPSGLQYRVAHIKDAVFFLERPLVVDDTVNWLQAHGDCFVTLSVSGLRAGALINHCTLPGKYTVTRVSHEHGLVFAAEHIETSDLQGWSVVCIG